MKAPFWLVVITFSLIGSLMGSLIGFSQPLLAQVGTPNPEAAQPTETDTPETDTPMGSAADLLVYDADLSTLDLEVSQPPGSLNLPGPAASRVVSPHQPNNSLIWLPNNEAPSDRLNFSGS